MARRRSQKRADEEEAKVILGVSVLLGLGAFGLTKSVVTAIVVAVLTLGVIIAIYIIISFNRRERLRQSGIVEIDKMTGRQFEEYLGYLFRSLGYQTTVTPASGDRGTDLILQKDGKRIAVQAKRYEKNVPFEAVQQVHYGKDRFKTHEQWVVTNSSYTADAISEAKISGVRLIGREELIALILQSKAKKGAVPQVTVSRQEVSAAATKNVHNHDQDDDICTKCGAVMMLRKTSKGYAMVCANFPQCRHYIVKGVAK